MRKIVIDYPTYRLEIPVIEVAKNRANYYANVDSFEVGSEEYQQEVDMLMNDNYEVEDWLVNNTDPSDFKDVAKVVFKENEVDWDYWGGTDITVV